MKKTLSIILIVLSAIISVVAIIFAILNDKEKTLDENVVIIRDTYNELSNNSTNNILLRKELIERLKKFEEIDYASVHEEYLELLKNYENSVKKLDQNIEVLNSKCDINYENSTTNILCRSYEDLYEEAINIYITNTMEYNNRINSYNIKNKTDYATYNMIHSKYIDLNKDGTYKGF